MPEPAAPQTPPPGHAARGPRWPWSTWPLGLVIAVGVTLVVGLPTAGYYTYRTYDYIEHDNEFCMSCHLMAGPFEAFDRSEHRGLGCKACHQPSLMGRSQMALTQVLEQPEELEQHAEIDDAICAACHVDGDPDSWSLIANSAGHRVHLESPDPDLATLECVTCHSTSVHGFAASDETCAASGCHTDSEVHLGRMGDFEIGCSSCHSFRAPVEPEGDLIAAKMALRPGGAECLSCHVMRERVDLVPIDLPLDPHGGECSDCHDAHDQENATDAEVGCSSASCHVDPTAESTFHVGLVVGTLEDCTSCHAAHTFEADGSDCVACHGTMTDDRSLTGTGSGGAAHTIGMRDPAGAAVGAFSTVVGVGVGVNEAVTDRATDRATHRAADRLTDRVTRMDGLVHDPSPVQEVSAFLHSQHTEEACLSCHSAESGHGTVTIRTNGDCQSCHHEAPRVDDCSTCHTAAEADLTTTYEIARPLALSTGPVTSRDLPFDHDVHAAQDCVTCHTEAPLLSATRVECNSCHVEHHEPQTDCAACHAPAPEDAHPLRRAHLTCGGSGCHSSPPFEEPPETRTACLACHQELVEHEPQATCVTCHPVSAP